LTAGWAVRGQPADDGVRVTRRGRTGRLRRLGHPGQLADDGVRVTRRGRAGRLRRLGHPGQPAAGAGITAAFLRWTFLRAVFHRRYVLAALAQASGISI